MGPWCRLALWFALLSGLPAAGAATRFSYEGELIPGNYEAPVRLKLQLEDENGILTGVGQAQTPATLAVRFNGSRVGDACTGTLRFANENMARLEGECNQDRFEGKFKLFPKTGKKLTGLFRMQGIKEREPEAAEKKEADKDAEVFQAAPGKSPTACLKLKVACLSACPQGEYNAEFLCANSCRRKEAKCLGKSKGFKTYGSPVPARRMPTFPEDGFNLPGGTESGTALSPYGSPPGGTAPQSTSPSR